MLKSKRLIKTYRQTNILQIFKLKLYLQNNCIYTVYEVYSKLDNRKQI